MTFTEETSDTVIQWLISYKNATDEKKKKQFKTLIVIDCMPLVKKIACSLARRATDPLDDLIQAGAIGLVKAIDFFDPTVSSKFKTYATYLITGEIRHYLRDKTSMIKAPREFHELSLRISTAMQKLSEDGYDEPTSEQIAELLSIPVNKVNDAIEVDRRKSTISLDQALAADENDSFSLADKLSAGDYQEFLTDYEEKIMLKHAINTLPEDLKQVIELNYYQDLNQRQIANKLNISQMQVSRRIKKALSKIYDAISENNDNYEREKDEKE